MKKIVKYGCYALLAIAVYLLWYAMVAFTQFDLNPENWSLSVRGIIPLFGTLSIGALIGAIENS